MSYYLGIFGGAGPNPSAALLKDKKIIAFAEEERFIRVKTAPGNLPINAILYCLKTAQIKLNSIKKIGFGWDCPHHKKVVPKILKKISRNYNKSNNSYNLNHQERVNLNYDPEKLISDLKWALMKKSEKLDEKKIIFYKHHLSHAASVFFASGFKNASIVILDGMGEEFTGGIYSGSGKNIKCLKKIKLPNSLGGYYATFTEFLGFKNNLEEGKLMALASYGKFSKKIQKSINNFLRYNNKTGDFNLKLDFRFIGKRSHNRIFTDK